MVSGNPLRSDLLSSSKDRVLKHDLFEKQHVMGYIVEAQHLGVSKRLLHCMMQACACAHFLLFRPDALRAIKQVHEQLIVHGAKARLCVEHLRFDDTPLKMRLRDPERPIAPDSGHDVQLQQPGSVILPILDTYTSCHVVKILQTERSVSLLYVLPNGKSLHFRFRLPTHLKCLSSGPAEMFFRALRDSRLQLPSAVTENFTHRLHLFCTDGDLALGRCIRAFASQTGGFEALRVKCEIQKVYSWHKSVFNQIAPILSKLKHIAFAPNSGDSMRCFRLRRPNSTSSSSDMKHNVACLDLLMFPTNATARVRRALILYLANGP